MVERELLWYMDSKNFPERHYWNFLIVNELREINLIKQKLYENLGYIIEERTIDKGKVKDSDLFYELFCLETTKPSIDFSRIYKGKLRKDRILQPRKTSGGWNNLVNKIACGEFS